MLKEIWRQLTHRRQNVLLAVWTARAAVICDEAENASNIQGEGSGESQDLIDDIPRLLPPGVSLADISDEFSRADEINEGLPIRDDSPVSSQGRSTTGIHHDSSVSTVVHEEFFVANDHPDDSSLPNAQLRAPLVSQSSNINTAT